MSLVTLRATTAADVAKMLQKVAYVNLRQTPTPGHRGFDMETTIECEGGDRAPLPTAKGYVFVQKAADPVLRISGQSIVTHEREQVKNGVDMLPDIKIAVLQPDAGQFLMMVMICKYNHVLILQMAKSRTRPLSTSWTGARCI